VIPGPGSFCPSHKREYRNDAGTRDTPTSRPMHPSRRGKERRRSWGVMSGYAFG